LLIIQFVLLVPAFRPDDFTAGRPYFCKKRAKAEVPDFAYHRVVKMTDWVQISAKIDKKRTKTRIFSEILSIFAT